jgi:hypothetical protein
MDDRLLASVRYWVYALAAALLLGTVGGTALTSAAVLDGPGPVARLVLVMAGVWGLVFAVLGVRLALRYRAGEPPAL